jgi:hypothetical protein
LQPPQFVVALVMAITSSRLLQTPFFMESQIVPFEILSHEQTWAVSGRSIELPNEEPPSFRLPRINSYAFSGIRIPFK